jgi:hypothetical protein
LNTFPTGRPVQHGLFQLSICVVVMSTSQPSAHGRARNVSVEVQPMLLDVERCQFHKTLTECSRVRMLAGCEVWISVNHVAFISCILPLAGPGPRNWKPTNRSCLEISRTSKGTFSGLQPLSMSPRARLVAWVFVEEGGPPGQEPSDCRSVRSRLPSPIHVVRGHHGGLFYRQPQPYAPEQFIGWPSKLATWERTCGPLSGPST